MRYCLTILLLLCPALLAAQATTTTTTPAGDTVIATVYATAKPVTVQSAVTIDSVVTVLRKAKVKPDTVPIYLPSPVVASRDTAFVVTPYPLGKPLGPFNGFNGYTALQPGNWTGTLQSTSPSGLPQQLATARAKRLKNIVLTMTGGSHDRYITNGHFDLAKWKAAQAAFNTPAIRAAVDSAVKDGTVIGNSLLDEPNHSSWGGVPTPAMLDEMSRYVKAIFPSLKTAVVVRWDWQQAVNYASLDFLISQYSYRFGSVAAYVDSATASTKRRSVGLMFSMNVLDGGTRATPCPAGSYNAGSCMMTPTEIVAAGKALLGSSACGLFMWQYDESYMARPENVGAFAELSTYAARRPAPPCQRP